MKYSELIQFGPIREAVQLCAADQAEAARRLVSTLQISGDLAARCTGQIFPRWQWDRPSDTGALFLVGPRGAGKSHLLAALSSLAERGELTAAVPAGAGLNPAPIPADPATTGLAAIAGRFQVVRAALDPAATSLREFLLNRLDAFLDQAGVPYDFPPSTRQPGEPPDVAGLMEALQATFPEQGLLLVVDDLLDYLLARKPRGLAQDVDFLCALAEASRNLRFRLVASAEKSPFDHPALESAASGLKRLKALCAEVELGFRDLQFVVARRLVEKTPEQRARVEAHLSRFAPSYGGMKERLAEFVDVFPLHPDYIRVLGLSVFAERAGALQLMSATVSAQLEQEVPADAPGVIAYDSYWKVICADPARRDDPETAAVIDFGRQLEKRLADRVPPPDCPELAQRIVHALSVRRLTAEDLYSDGGATAEELRDSLCLYQPPPEGAAADPAGALLVQVGNALDTIRQAATGSLISVHREDSRYNLHFRKFRRFSRPELVLHWANAVPFLLLLLTGAIMLGSRFSNLDRGLFTWTVNVHKACALAWLCAVPLSVLTRLKAHWAHIRIVISWGAKDVAWIVQSVRALYNKAAIIPAAGRFNTGQKINACLVVVYFFGFAATGALMLLKGTILVPWYVHTALFFSAMGSVGGHLFLALVNPSTRIAIAGIFHGWAPMKYIEHHHSLSLPRSLQGHAHPVSVRTAAEEMFVSRVEIGVLLGTLLLAGAGAYAFGEGRLASVKKQFAKSFSDVIQPSELTTKHRIGPTAESCTKCHNFAGEIPDQKCEQCHEDVKDRRTELLGYHGTLKGDCRKCHREHREHMVSMVPLNQAKFNHNEAMFKLVGRHTEVKCDDCHKKTRTPDTPGIYYLGLSYEKCADCHHDQHSGQFAAACESCHSSPAGWTGQHLKFRHETGSDFPLVGLHAAVECRKCHQPSSLAISLGSAKFKGLARDCAGCHEDPHRKQFGTRCTDCHSPAGWQGKNLNFVHNKDSKFPLVGQHAQVACDKCHQPAKAGEPLARAQFVGLRTDCADCHQDPHRGQFARDCTKCHATPETWKVSAPRFVHDRDTKFSLAGKHAAVDCIQCHKPRPEGAPLASAKFKGLEATCEKCHAVQHPVSYGTTCIACHTPAAWPRKKPAFDHGRDTGFDLIGKHLLAKCSSCHSEARLGVLNPATKTKTTCLACHQKEEPHKGVLGNDCQKCHSSVSWKGEDLLFEHNTMASFSLNADHVNVACVNCHKNGVWKPLDAACSSCHKKFFGQ